MDGLQKTIGNIFLQMAEGLETGSFGPKPRIALTGLGSEHGEANALAAANAAADRGVEVFYIGSQSAPNLRTVPAANEADAHAAMEDLLASGAVDGAVTMHYPFPIGVSTVGRVCTPAFGREMFIATTTGTASADRVQGLVKNAVYGIITAKACGIENPSVGILNVEGARQAETILKQMAANGYDIHFASSKRADGGLVLRGNDVLQATADVLVCDPLTGNVLMKLLSAYSTGGSFEALGYGYGPGVGPGYDKLIMIISRASGAPVIANAITYAAQLVQGNLFAVAEAEFAAAQRAGMDQLLNAYQSKNAPRPAAPSAAPPPAEPVTAQIPGIEVMDLEDAVQTLWQSGIYAESGMGCTGPIVLIAEPNKEKAAAILQKAGFIG